MSLGTRTQSNQTNGPERKVYSLIPLHRHHKKEKGPEKRFVRRPPKTVRELFVQAKVTAEQKGWEEKIPQTAQQKGKKP